MKTTIASAGKLIAMTLLFFCLQFTYAQDYAFGIKAGLNYTLGNDGSELTGNLGQFSATSDIGYFFGGFGEMTYKSFFLRPEVFYTHLTAEFDFPVQTIDYSINKISVPLLIGYNVYGPLDIFAGPSFQYILNSELQNVNGDFNVEQSKINAQFGLKFNYTNWELDIRYEYNPPTDNLQIVDIKNVMNNAYFDDGRLNNIMLSVNYKIFDTKTYSARQVIDK